MGLTAREIPMTGSDVEYQFPADVLAVAFQAVGADIELRTSELGDGFTLYDAAPGITIQGRSLANSSIWFNGAAGKIEALEQTGLGS